MTNAQLTPETTRRRAALSLVATAEPQALAAVWATWWNRPPITLIRGPESGLIMLRGRTGGGGAPFNLGEATISRASLAIDTGEVGHGYCLGRDLERATVIATIDALFQREPDNVDLAILRPLAAAAAERAQTRREEAAATKVDFFTIVRGED